MLAGSVVIVLTLVWLRVLAWLYHRGAARRAATVTNVYGDDRPGSRTDQPPAVDTLDDAAFPAWLGVSPESYRRYVADGFAGLALFLGDQTDSTP